MLSLIKMGYIRLFKNYLFKILPIKDNYLQDLSTLFYWYVYINLFLTYWR